MPPDPCKQKINSILIKCGEALFPGEKNVTTLLNKTSALLGIPPEPLTSKMTAVAPHLVKADPFLKCPWCGIRKLKIAALGSCCKDSEYGKYKTLLSCSACDHSEKSEKQVVTLLVEFGHDFSSAQKKDLGIETLTDRSSK
jgi:hypothetical protein